MDPLDDLFGALRVANAMHARLEAAAPWGIRFVEGETARFGLMVEGACRLEVEGRAAIPLAAGDCYVVMRGRAYSLRDAAGSPTRNCFDVIGDRVGGTIALGGEGTRTCVITGWFRFDELGARPRLDQARSDALQAALQMLATETAGPGLGSGIVVSRLTDILLIHAIRQHAMAAGPEETGWLGALADRKLLPAFRALHGGGDRRWTGEALAARCGMSRSAFAAYFRARVGETPLAYDSHWRMLRAGALLRAGGLSIGEIAARAGYESEAAFSRAFRRQVGVAPGQFRRARVGDPIAEVRAGAQGSLEAVA